MLRITEIHDHYVCGVLTSRTATVTADRTGQRFELGAALVYNSELSAAHHERNKARDELTEEIERHANTRDQLNTTRHSRDVWVKNSDANAAEAFRLKGEIETLSKIRAAQRDTIAKQSAEIAELRTRAANAEAIVAVKIEKAQSDADRDQLSALVAACNKFIDTPWVVSSASISTSEWIPLLGAFRKAIQAAKDSIASRPAPVPAVWKKTGDPFNPPAGYRFLSVGEFAQIGDQWFHPYLNGIYAAFNGCPGWKQEARDWRLGQLVRRVSPETVNKSAPHARSTANALR